jgi:hypothetical protein
MRFFEGAFSDPKNWEYNPQPDRAPALEASASSSRFLATPSRRRSWKQRSSSQKVSQPTTGRSGSRR